MYETIRGENDIAKVSKSSSRYRFRKVISLGHTRENNFVGDSSMTSNAAKKLLTSSLNIRPIYNILTVQWNDFSDPYLQQNFQIISAKPFSP